MRMRLRQLQIQLCPICNQSIQVDKSVAWDVAMLGRKAKCPYFACEQPMTVERHDELKARMGEGEDKSNG